MVIMVFLQFQSYLYGIEMSVFDLKITDYLSFNRTFMELKSERATSYLLGPNCFNRTFMELK